MATRLHDFSWQRMIEAVEAVRDRALRVTAALEPLVRMKLNSFRDKDRMHLRDLIALGLVDDSWFPSLVPEHAVRLRQLLDDPGG